jgi:hypothetical protein
LNVMRIEINNSKTLTILEQNLIVKNNKLFNTLTNKYEAIDGDKVLFCILNEKGDRTWLSGIVEGYTCNRRIKLKGVHELYAAVKDEGKLIEHNSSITDTDYVKVEEEIKQKIKTEEKEEDDWSLILSA